MSEQNQVSPESTKPNHGFTFKVIKDFFEVDTHVVVQDLGSARVRILHGQLPEDDLYLLIYEGSPQLSIFNFKGQLVDIDHYLPDDYNAVDAMSTEDLINNFDGLNEKFLSDDEGFHALIDRIHNEGGENVFFGLDRLFGIECPDELAEEYVHGVFGNFTLKEAGNQIKSKFATLKEFLTSLFLFLQKKGSGYIHITSKGNIIITPLLRRSGLALILETQNSDGQLVAPEKWNVTRTKNVKQLEQTLVFRTNDVQTFFEKNISHEYGQSTRYTLFRRQNELLFDSLLDSTDNLLRVSLYNDCFQVLAADEEVVVILSDSQTLTLVNAHKSIVPQKWAQTIKLPFDVQWARVDQGVNAVFVQDDTGMISVLSIDQDSTKLISEVGIFAPGFEVDQSGNILVKNDAGQLTLIQTNINALENPDEAQSVHTVLKNIEHLFNSDQLFSQKQFARTITEEEKKVDENLPPSIIDKMRFNFETNVEHMLSSAGNRYEELLNIKEQLSLARQNLSAELVYEAEKEQIQLVGIKLRRIVNSILSPIERRVHALVEFSRSSFLLKRTEVFVEEIATLEDPDSYRAILNETRAFQEEFQQMNSDHTADNYEKFLLLQKQLSSAFANQIAKDDSNLASFIRGEIEQIELAISRTHEAKQLEILLSTHPASLELMDILKQPFVLRSIAKERTFSPSLIQQRLYRAVETRLEELRVDQARQQAEQLAAKEQLAKMCVTSIEFFVDQHSGSFSSLELQKSAAYNQLQDDFYRIEDDFGDTRLANELRRRLERKILERSRQDLEKIVAFEGKYAFIQNDPDLYVDDEASVNEFPEWNLKLIEKKGVKDAYLATFIRSSDYAVYRPSIEENLAAKKSFEIHSEEFDLFWKSFQSYKKSEFSKPYLSALWQIYIDENKPEDFPEFKDEDLEKNLPQSIGEMKALRCALETMVRHEIERTRVRQIPQISPEFIDDTPYFRQKLHEFIIKAKLQLMSGSGIILLTGPPSTGKSAFLKFAAWVMNREYFEHSADKWQTKNSLVTAIKFSEFGPYATPASFTQAITTPNCLINIEEIKEWPEALRKSLNPFFGGSNIFTSPDGTAYTIGKNILLCAAANLGSMYRQDNEPFTADFWSRIEVVEYDYSPNKVSDDYIDALFAAKPPPFLTISEVLENYFKSQSRPAKIQLKAISYAKQFVEFMVLPKADEKVKRKNIQNYINEYFNSIKNELENEIFDPKEDSAGVYFNPEEAAKIVLKRIKTLRQFTIVEFYDLFDHVINKSKLRSAALRKLTSADPEQFNQIKTQIFVIRYLEGALRHLRSKFYDSAGQTEVEGTNREFIKGALLLNLLDDL